TAATSPARPEKSASPRDSAYRVARSDSEYCSVLGQSTALDGNDKSCDAESPSGVVNTTRSPTRAYSPRHDTTVPLVRNSRKSGTLAPRADAAETSRSASVQAPSRPGRTRMLALPAFEIPAALTLLSVARQHAQNAPVEIMWKNGGLSVDLVSAKK